MLSHLAGRKGADVTFTTVVPVLRIFDLTKAREFYVDYLGFQVDWEHRFAAEAPLYMQVSRNGLRLHLSEHHGDGTPGSVVYVETRGVRAYHAELQSKRYPSLNPGIGVDEIGTCMTVLDPFGNTLRFNEPPARESEAANAHRFYGELAAWWPLISPPADYEEEAGFVASLLRSAPIPVREVLELGSGGGHNAFHLKTNFTMTLVDLSEEMLEVSRRLNPGCEHQRGDMRSVRLERSFDAVFVHDAIDYMSTEVDLRRAIETAFVHCRPGGVAVFVPDHTRETFDEGTDHGGSDADDGRGARYLEWTWDPDPADTSVVTEYGFLLRDADGTVRSVHETHRFGLFDGESWLRFLTEAGFEARAVTEVTSDDRPARQLYVGLRPLRSG